MTVRRRFATLGLSAALVIGAALGGPAAAAEPIGDGVTAPTHDVGTAVIPLCNPINVVTWLIVNFTDHGRDIANYKITLQTPTQVFQYAGADALFHLPATVASLGGFLNPVRYCTLSYAPRTGV